MAVQTFAAGRRVRVRWLRVAAICALVGAVTVVTFGFLQSRADPIERRTDIAVQGWPAGARPMTIALLADIHFGGAAMDAGRLERIVDQVNRARPDLVLIAGDFVEGHDPMAGKAYAAGLAGPLSRLRAPLGVIAVLGNHDHWTSPGAILTALEAAHVSVLMNEAARRGPLTVIGVDDRFSGHDRLDRALDQADLLPPGPRLVLTHSPDLASELPGDVPIVLAGHTHCGQVTLPLIGFLPGYVGFRPFNPRYRCGIVHDPGRLVIVTAGLGTSQLPIRIGAPPDFWLVRLGPPAH
jgi:predicted MPP superfamily phosphohydrolase